MARLHPLQRRRLDVVARRKAALDQLALDIPQDPFPLFVSEAPLETEGVQVEEQDPRGQSSCARAPCTLLGSNVSIGIGDAVIAARGQLIAS
jgi:hypothetical protein